MKITFVLIIVGIFMFPLQQANAVNNGAFYKHNERNLAAAKQTTKKDLNVKNRQQATQMVKARYKAKVLSVSALKANGKPGYRAKLLGTDGIVFYVDIDAASGNMKRR